MLSIVNPLGQRLVLNLFSSNSRVQMILTTTAVEEWLKSAVCTWHQWYSNDRMIKD